MNAQEQIRLHYKQNVVGKFFVKIEDRQRCCYFLGGDNPLVADLIKIDGEHTYLHFRDPRIDWTLCKVFDSAFEDQGGPIMKPPSLSEQAAARKLAVASADYWYQAARDPSYSMAERLLFMENALNHVEGAYVAAYQEANRLHCDIDYVAGVQGK